MKKHPNIITFRGLIEPSKEQMEKDKGKTGDLTMPDFLFDFIETSDKEPFQRRGVHSVGKLINDSTYFHSLEKVRLFMY